MTLTPNSDSLVEYNPCHDPRNGKFAGRREGRCNPEVLSTRKDLADEVRKGYASSKTAAEDRAFIRKGQKHLKELPGFLRRDALTAFKNDRAVVDVDTWRINDDSAMGRMYNKGSSASLDTRRVTLRPQNDKFAGSQRVSMLTTMRHELGHIAPDELKRQGRMLGTSFDELHKAAIAERTRQVSANLTRRGEGQTPNVKLIAEDTRQYADKLVEEIRAWRNAIRTGRGRISVRRMGEALGTYFKGVVGPGTLVERRVLKTLARYAQMVRRRNPAVRKPRTRAKVTWA